MVCRHYYAPCVPCWQPRCISFQDPITPAVVESCKFSKQRTRDIIQALSALFRCSPYVLINIFFKLAYLENLPITRYPRERIWSVMANVKAPYSEKHDLEIYDSMYDRCGNEINPLDPDNILKIVRMMFLGKVLTIEQRNYLGNMLQRLNQRNIYQVKLKPLLKYMAYIDKQELACHIINENYCAGNLSNGLKYRHLCDANGDVFENVPEPVPSPVGIKDKKKPKKPKPQQKPKVFCTLRPHNVNGELHAIVVPRASINRRAKSSTFGSMTAETWAARHLNMGKTHDYRYSAENPRSTTWSYKFRSIPPSDKYWRTSPDNLVGLKLKGITVKDNNRNK